MNINYWDMDSWSYGKPVWVVKLSDGNIFYQDDSNGPSWLTLKEHVSQNNLLIENLGIKYFDHEEWLNESADGYYFSNGAIGFMNVGTFQCKNIGFLKDGKIHVKTYRCPEVLEVDYEIRPYTESEYLICSTSLV